MDWITFIKWNGIVYATYYGANLLVDFLQTKRELSPKSSFTEYQLKDLEKPKIIKSADFLKVDKKKAESKPEGKATKPANQQKDNQITFNTPIERQGIPMNEYIKVACKSGNDIFQPTI